MKKTIPQHTIPVIDETKPNIIRLEKEVAPPAIPFYKKMIGISVIPAIGLAAFLIYIFFRALIGA